jgi:hypothetical protein
MCEFCEKMKQRSGYRGQKYHVVADDSNGAVKSLGWQEAEKPSLVFRNLALHYELTNVRCEAVHKEQPSDR